MVENLETTIIIKHCLCVMFAFQLGYLYISNDVLYDFDNFVSSSLY